MLAISPFQRTRELLINYPEKDGWIDMSIGAPKHEIPSFMREIIHDNFIEFQNYPSANSNINFGKNISKWLSHRHNLQSNDYTHNILPISGSREGIFFGSLLAKKLHNSKSIFILPNPFYPVYATAGHYTDRETLAINVSEENDFFIDLSMVDDNTWSRTIAFYLCSPSNPQGSIASIEYLEKLYEISLRYDFVIIADECYSEIYRDTAPYSIIKVAEKNKFKNILSFNSLSKRSNAPGLRSGFVFGEENLINKFFDLRNVSAPTVPTPIQIASEALWGDEDHVIENRKLYNQKFQIFQNNIDKKFNFNTPSGGFFAWLEISEFGTDEQVTINLWSEGLKVIPGSYLSVNAQDYSSAGNYIRIALVGSNDDVKRAAEIINKVLN
jgi:aspartate/methionine/tyrosine aminotransferase